MQVKLPGPHVTGSPRRVTGRAFVPAACLVLLLSACGGEAPQDSAPSSTATAPTPSTTEAAPQVAATDSANAAARGEQALREQRLFLPPSDNAFELFLAAVETNPTDQRSKLALQDLVPYAVLHVEQRLAAEDADDAARVLALLARAAAEAPALPRLQAGLAGLQQRQASAQAAAEAAAARAAAASAAPAPVPAAVAPAPAPAVAGTPPAAAPERAPSEPSATPAPVASEPVPAPQPVSSPPARAAAPVTPPRVPEVVFRPALRYPPIAERRRLEGSVEIEFTIGIDGSVSQLEVLRSQPEGVFDREALAAMERWRFAPPEAPMRARRTLEFKLAR